MNQAQPTFEESVAQMMRGLPTIIQSYIAEEKYSVVAQSLMARYRLRVDQGGILEREILLMLMGVESSAEFSQTLSDEAKIDQASVSRIVQDVNEQIFIPLREQMRNADTVAAQPARSAPPPPRAAVVNAPVPNYAPEERPVAPAPVATPPVKTPVPAPSQNRQTQQSATASLPPRFGVARPALTTLPRPEAVSLRLEDHEMARLEFQTASVAAPAATPVARTAPPPENLPGATPPTPPPAPAAPVPPRVESPVIPLPPTIQRPTAPAPAPVAPARPPYSADPYREPIES